eukprot:GFUD01019580.1.p2 GENE.GFUD01019580.1~~GFUD01019580.1.p2  ORF type:complete len:179 (+),score=60.97 GFUD01019580.1:153-689(+)
MTSIDWRSREFRRKMKEELQEALEENLRKMGSIKGVAMNIVGREVKEPFAFTQTMKTIMMNAEMMEEEMFWTSTSKTQYMGKLMHGVFSGDVFSRKKVVVGCKRWCWEEDMEVCKVLLKVDKQEYWADCMEYEEYEELVRKMSDNDAITSIPFGVEDLLKEVAWRDFFRSKNKDLNNN